MNERRMNFIDSYTRAEERINWRAFSDAVDAFQETDFEHLDELGEGFERQRTLMAHIRRNNKGDLGPS